MPETAPHDPWFQVSQIVNLIRSGDAATKPELAKATGLGRNVVTQRIQAASKLGLLRPDGLAQSRGGRPADVWRFCGDSGVVVVAVMESLSCRVALTDLDGVVLRRRDLEWAASEGPLATCERVAEIVRELLREQGVERPWGIGLALHVPVDFVAGRFADPVPTTKGFYRWSTQFDIRTWFSDHFGVPTFIDAASNLMALGALATHEGSRNLAFIRLSTGLGAGLVSDGRIHRGSTWLAGELAHITAREDSDRMCMCGRKGCLDTYASGWAMVDEARRAVTADRSPFLAEAAQRGPIDIVAVSEGAVAGDVACVEITARAAESLGRVLAQLVAWHNPDTLVIGGFEMAQNPLFQSVVERTLRAHSFPPSVADLKLTFGDGAQNEALLGAAALVTDALILPGYLAEWGPLGSPLNAPQLRTHPRQT